MKLLACPFCGEDATVRRNGLIGCSSLACHAALSHALPQDWNRRAPAVQATSDADGLAREIVMALTVRDLLRFGPDLQSISDRAIANVAAVLRKAVSPAADEGAREAATRIYDEICAAMKDPKLIAPSIAWVDLIEKAILEEGRKHSAVSPKAGLPAECTHGVYAQAAGGSVVNAKYGTCLKCNKVVEMYPAPSVGEQEKERG